MKTIIYTAPEPVSNETELIEGMLGAGADFLFLRRRETVDSHYWMTFLERIPSAYYPRIFTTDFRVLHEMELGGFHFKGDVLANMEQIDLRENLGMLRKRGISSSRTVRNMEGMELSDGQFDLLLAAPIFKSISKPEHFADWNFEDLKSFLNKKQRQSTVVALGGVKPEKMDILHLLGVDGVAILGALWKQPEYAIDVFKNILDKCQ